MRANNGKNSVSPMSGHLRTTAHLSSTLSLPSEMAEEEEIQSEVQCCDEGLTMEIITSCTEETGMEKCVCILCVRVCLPECVLRMA